jgi:hypothetical protein
MTASLLLAAAYAVTQVTTYEYDELGRVIAERCWCRRQFGGRATPMIPRAG